MNEKPLTLRKALPLQTALDHLKASDLSGTLKASFKSTAIDAVRWAVGNGTAPGPVEAAMQADLRELLEMLPELARRAAVYKEHQKPGEHAGRARRFAEFILGGRSLRALRRAAKCPPAWQPLASAIKMTANGQFAFLAHCCHLAGFADAPARMPTIEQLSRVAGALNPDHLDRALVRLEGAASLYRKGRASLLAAAKPGDKAGLLAQFAPLQPRQRGDTTHLGIEEVTAAMLESLGLDHRDMTPEEQFRVLYPQLAKDYDCWANQLRCLLSERYKKEVLGALLRLAGWAARADRAQALQGLQNLCGLFTETETLPGKVELNPRVAEMRQARSTEGAESPVMSLLGYLLECEAPRSLARSTLVDPGVLESMPEGATTFVTDSLLHTAKLLWYITEDTYHDLGRLGGEDAATWALVTTRWKELKDSLSDRRIPAKLRKYAKNKVKIIQQVTLPQLVCVALPLRRREILGMRDDWLTARDEAATKGHDPDRHPVVKELEDLYLTSALPFTALCLTADDGLRRAQYERGRAGFATNFSIVLTYDEHDAPSGIREMTTTWTGDPGDPARVKIDEVDDRVAFRGPRPISWGCVDRAIVFDILTRLRSQELVTAGLLADRKQFDLVANLQAGEHALFLSGRSGEPGLPRLSLGDAVGRELHYVVRNWLRPDLPVWDDLGPEWRSLWAIHILRLLIGSYWGYVRKDWARAEYLTMDKEETLRESYVAVDRELTIRMKRDKTNWEHPKAYDVWMDRLLVDQEVFDPILDPELPLPPHVEDTVTALRAGGADSRIETVPSGRKPRIRRARPGQPQPEEPDTPS